MRVACLFKIAPLLAQCCNSNEAISKHASLCSFGSVSLWEVGQDPGLKLVSMCPLAQGSQVRVQALVIPVGEEPRVASLCHRRRVEKMQKKMMFWRHLHTCSGTVHDECQGGGEHHLPDANRNLSGEHHESNLAVVVITTALHNTVKHASLSNTGLRSNLAA